MVAVIVCFTFGMLTESISGKLVDEDNFLQRQVIGRVPNSKTDDLIKQISFFGEGEKISAFAMEAARYDLIRRFGGEYSEKLQNTILCDKNLSAIPDNEKRDVALRFYYHAKNTVYKESTYFNELHTIQLRIDFARSGIAVSAFLMITTLILFIFSEFNNAFNYRNKQKILSQFLVRINRIPKEKRSKASGRIQLHFERTKKTRRNRFVFVIGFLSIFFLANILVYNDEEKNFDKRALGYFVSMNANVESKVQCKQENQIAN